jgi:PKD repeat protein
MTPCISANINRTSGAADLLRMRTAANGPVIKVSAVGTNGNLQIRSDFGSTTINSNVAIGTGWHNVELCGTVGSNTTWDLYRDGTEIINDWVANTGTSPVGRIQIGDTAATKTFTINFDHVILDEAPGDGATGETTPPGAPGTPAGNSPSAGTIVIGWTAATDPAPASLPITYRVFEVVGATNNQIGTTTNTSFTHSGLIAGSSHTYRVQAVDAANNVGPLSGTSASIVVASNPSTGGQPVPGHTRIAYDVPRNNTPRVTTGDITDLEYIGNRVFVVGNFTSVQNRGTNTTTYNQPSLFSFNLDTGLVDANFRPTFGGGGVQEVEASPDGTKLFVTGSFNTVNGVTKRKIASINPITGATVQGFTANANSQGTAIEATNTTVYVGGMFSAVNGTPRNALVALNATTGAVVPGFVNNITGGIGTNGTLRVQALALTHDNSKLLVVHTGRQINGQDRYAAALIDTATNQLLPWRTRLWDDNLQFVGGVTRVIAGAIAPDDSYFVISSGAGGDRPPISDTIVAYPLVGGDDVQPLWISRMFDSVYSLAVSEVAVYAGGHFNWNESPTAPDPWPGLDNVGYGRGQGLEGYGLGDDVVVRDHVGAVDPTYGKSLDWNPGSNSFEGNQAILVMPRGVVTGGDGNTQGMMNGGRIAVYDFNSMPSTTPNDSVINNPIEGRVEESDVPFTVDGTATAASGVQRVEVMLRERDTNQYLQDNMTWGNASNTINATLASPGATSTAWSLSGLTISDNHRILLYSRTFATNGTNEPLAARPLQRIETFGVTDQTPTTSITGPSTSVIPTQTFTITGTGSDDFGVNSIRVSIRDAQNRYLQDDGTAQSTYNTFTVQPDVIGATSATWSWEVTVPYEGEWEAGATAVDTAGQSDLRDNVRTWIVSDTAVPPTVEIASPAVMIPPVNVPALTMAPGSPVTFSGTATDDEGLHDVTITLRNNSTGERLASDGTWGTDVSSGNYRISPLDIGGTTYNWSYTTPFDLTSGTYDFTVRATDDLGLTTSSSNQGELTINVQVPGDAFPNATISPTGTQNGLQVLHLDLAGAATDDIGVSAVRVRIEEQDSSRYLQSNGTLSANLAYLDATLANPGATSTTWTLSVDLPVQGDYSVAAIAWDTSNQQDPSTSGATSRYPIYPGDQPPTVTENLFAPVEGTQFTDGRIVSNGRVEDDQQIAEAHVAIRNALGQYMSSSGTFTSTNVSWRNAFLNSPGSPGSNFAYTSPVIPPGSYTVFARGEDQHGFTTPVPIERHVTVTGSPTSNPPVASFTYSCVENVCSFDGRSSTDETPATLTYSWNFGNGSGSGPVPTRTYTSPGTFTVTLTVRDENNLTGVTSQQVTIVEPAGNLPPTPVISPPVCTARTCSFSSSSSTDPNTGDSFSRLWNFGDGTTSTSTSPSKTYAADGIYTVTLTVTDGWGDFASTTRTVTIAEPAGNLPPTPVIGAPVCVARACNLFGTASSDPNGDPFTYLWNFGSGTTTSTSATPSFTYPADGTYTVTLTVTDAWGDAASTTRSVTITEPAGNLPPVPVINPPSCVGKVCSMSSAGSADPNGDAFTYLWNFGDGTATSTSSAPSHTFPGNGPYTVTLTLTDAWGDFASATREVSFAAPPTNQAPTTSIDTPVCTARSCTFSATTSDPDGDTFTYLWSFGDASTSTVATPTHAFAADGTYTVSVTVTDTWGAASVVATRDVTIAKPASNVPPVPVINPVTCVVRTCTIYGVSSSDPNGDNFTYLWNFGDGTATSTSTSPSHAFAVDGTYTVTLTVTDWWGDAASTTREVVIGEPANNAAPVPVINAPSCIARTCSFSSAGTVDPNGDSIAYSWNWGDGTTNTTTANASHTFATVGTYTVTLTATDGWGDAASTTRQVSIVEPPTNVAPVPVIPVPSCLALVCTFTSTGSNDPNGDAVTYLWNFGDGTATSTAANPPAHTFPAANTYTVTLTITDVWGRSAFVTRNVTVA